MGKRERRCEKRFFLLTMVAMSMMNDNNDDDVDVGEVDGMGWGERMRWHRHRHGWRAEGTGQRDVIGGEDADANRRSHSTSALVRYVAGPRFLINNNHTIFSRRQPATRASGIGPHDKTLSACLYEVSMQCCLSLSSHLANAGLL
jgi:hypothetical protein